MRERERERERELGMKSVYPMEINIKSSKATPFCRNLSKVFRKKAIYI